MRTYRGSNYTLNSNSRKTSRPNSAAKRQLNIFKINTSSDVPPPIIFNKEIKLISTTFFFLFRPIFF